MKKYLLILIGVVVLSWGLGIRLSTKGQVESVSKIQLFDKYIEDEEDIRNLMYIFSKQRCVVPLQHPSDNDSKGEFLYVFRYNDGKKETSIVIFENVGYVGFYPIDNDHLIVNQFYEYAKHIPFKIVDVEGFTRQIEEYLVENDIANKIGLVN